MRRLFCSFSLMLLVALATTSCSLSYSGGKSSDSASLGLDSISTSLDSLSGSSGSDGDHVAAVLEEYEHDISVLTLMSDSRHLEEFQEQITAIAKSHGILDWERENSTYLAMGRGLKRAGVREEQLLHTPLCGALAPTLQQQELILAGYRSS